MDASNPSSQLSMANRTPMRIGSYALAVRDLERCADFYRQAVGFETVASRRDGVSLGVDGVALLHLEHRPDMKPDDPKSAGLFHTAFVMPSRRALADWYLHTKRIGLAITRTGDHAVNEALYFDDPEGNGGECYCDRPPESWQWDASGQLDIPTAPVDLEKLARDGGGDAGSWRVPDNVRIGHINLRVGAIAPSEKFFCHAVGLDHTGRRDIRAPGLSGAITFMSSGRYHHHVATNTFTSDGAGPRDPERAGLMWFTVEVEGAERLRALKARLAAASVATTPINGGFEVADPWGTRVRFVPA